MTLELLGTSGSPYTRKALAVLRYRRIPYVLHLGSHRDPMPGYPVPKVKLLPTFYFPQQDGMEAVTDSTPIITRLDEEYSERKVRPEDPALRLLDLLIEDYADEWLTKAMFHYRWAHAADAKNAGPLLAYWIDTTLSDEQGKTMAEHLTRRQQERLWVVGSNATTTETIESSWHRLIDLLDQRLMAGGFVLGARPAASDFALFGQLTQLGIVEPTPSAILATRSPRLRAWIDRVEDLSGLECGDWLINPAELRPLLTEIGRTYAPFLLANAAAVQAGESEFKTEIDGRTWAQPSFPYQAKCLRWLNEAYTALPENARTQVDEVLAGTGCEILFNGSAARQG